MNKKKSKEKARRRAKKLQDKAWEAVANDDLVFARKLMDQALEECQDNPVLWNDYGWVQQQLGDDAGAEKALRGAILIAPEYAEAHANLAALVARQGRTLQAAKLQRLAVQHDPGSEIYARDLATYEALRPRDEDPSVPTVELEETVRGSAPMVPGTGEAESRARPGYDWQQLEDELGGRGFAVLPGLLSPGECADLTALYDRDELFEKSVGLDGESGSGGVYRFFHPPLPEPVERLRSSVYEPLVPIVNRWSELLGRSARWPSTHREFLAQCAEGGQKRSTPILLRYRAPAVNHLHQDVWGRIFFPLQLAVLLSPPAEAGSSGAGFSGGAFVFGDQAGGRRAAPPFEVALSQGDGVLFCTRERIVKAGRRATTVPVHHGMAPLTAGERYALGIPFHNYK